MNKKLKIHISCIKTISSDNQMNTVDLVNCDFYYFGICNVNANQSFFKVMMQAPEKYIIYLCSYEIYFVCVIYPEVAGNRNICSYTINTVMYLLIKNESKLSNYSKALK